MNTFQCDPNVELNGISVYGFLSSLTHDEYLDVLEKYGFSDIDRDAWYPLQKVLDVLYEILERPGARVTLVSISMAAVDNQELPPQVSSMSPDGFFKLYEQLYPTRHRNGEVGTVTADAVQPGLVQITMDSNVPYPDDVMCGVFYAYMRRLLRGTDASFSVSYDDARPRKGEGGSETVYNIKWG